MPFGSFAYQQNEKHQKCGRNEAMERDLKEFYEVNLIPEHVRLLLGLHGVAFCLDLAEFGAEDIKEIEEEIRSGGYDDRVDFNDKNNQLKYLGMEFVDLGKFRFTSIDRKKLMTIRAAAKSIKRESRRTSAGSK